MELLLDGEIDGDFDFDSNDKASSESPWRGKLCTRKILRARLGGAEKSSNSTTHYNVD